MLSFYYPLNLLNIFLFCSLTVANRFAFGIQEIHVGNPVDNSEDDLTLAIVASTGVQNFTQNFTLGGNFTENTTTQWNNLNLEIDLGNELANLTVFFGLVNDPDINETQTTNLVNDLLGGAVSVINLIPGFSLVSGFLQLFTAIFSVDDCKGPAGIGNSSYSTNTLNGLEQNRKICKTEEFYYPDDFFDVIKLCGASGSNYTITYCLERLDAKNAAGTISPQSVVYISAVLVALGFSTLF